MELMEITKEEYDELLDQVKALKLMVQNLEDIVEDSIIGLNIRDNVIEARHMVDGTITATQITMTLDDIPDGISYGKLLGTSITAGQVLLSQASGNLDDIADGTYGKLLSTSLSSGLALLSACDGDFDDITNGTTYGKVNITNISAGNIVLAQCTGDLDDISNGSTYGKVALTSISAGKIIVAGLDSGITDRMFANLNTKNNIEAWRHASDVTLIDGGDIYANSLTIAKLATDATNKMFGADATKTNVEGWVHASDVTKIDGGDIYTDSITVRKITLDSAGYLKTTGKDSYADVTAGIWMGYSSGAYKLMIGDSLHYVAWNGSALAIRGSLRVGGTSNEDILFDQSGIRFYDFGTRSLAFTKSGYNSLYITLGSGSLTLATGSGFFSILCTKSYRFYDTGVYQLPNLASNPAGLTGGICMVNNALKYWNGSAWVIAT